MNKAILLVFAALVLLALNASACGYGYICTGSFSPLHYPNSYYYPYYSYGYWAGYYAPYYGYGYSYYSYPYYGYGYWAGYYAPAYYPPYYSYYDYGAYFYKPGFYLGVGWN